MSPEELRRQKELMEESFQKSAVAPGDANFVYDKQVDFQARKKRVSDWDSDDEEGDRPSSSFHEEDNVKIKEEEDDSGDGYGGRESRVEGMDAEESRDGNRSDIEGGEEEKDSDW